MWLNHITEFLWLQTAVLKRMPYISWTSENFGLRNVVQTFWRFIDVFRGLNFVHAYVNDCLKSSLDRESYVQHLEFVYQLSQKNSITKNTSKYQTGTNSRNIFEQINDTWGTNSLQSIVAVITGYQKSTTLKQLHKFKGLVSFIECYASLMRPLRDKLHRKAIIVNLNNNANKLIHTAIEIIKNATDRPGHRSTHWFLRRHIRLGNQRGLKTKDKQPRKPSAFFFKLLQDNWPR